MNLSKKKDTGTDIVCLLYNIQIIIFKLFKILNCTTKYTGFNNYYHNGHYNKSIL